MDNDAMMVSGVAILKEIYFSRCPILEINRVQKLVEEHQEQLLAGWNDFLNDHWQSMSFLRSQ